MLSANQPVSHDGVDAMRKPFLIPPIAAAEMTATVVLLLAIIERQQVTIKQQEELVEQLKAELARVKKLTPKPKIKPSTTGKNDNKDNHDGNSRPATDSAGQANNKRAGSHKRKKQINIHNTEIIPPEDIPAGSRFLGYQDFLVQDLIAFSLSIRAIV